MAVPQELYEEIIIAGFGGQGIILAGKLLAQTAMEAGREVTYMPSYGAEVRGGEDRANQREANLAAVRVAGQEEVDVVGSGPAELVGAVRQGDPQRAAAL